MNWVDELLDQYFRWLKEKTVTQLKDGGWAVISTPFLGPYNDAIELYARRDNGSIQLSDDGDTLSNLELAGISLSRSKQRRELVERILRTHGVTLDPLNSELRVDATAASFPQRKHNLLSAIIELNDLYVLASGSVASLFKEDVAAFLDHHRIIYTPDFIARGTTGLEFTFDFQIAGRRSETVLKAFNTMNKYTLAAFLFAWEDIRQGRTSVTKKEVNAIAIINDVAHDVRGEYLDAFPPKHANYILWSQREERLGLLLEQ